MGQQHADGAAPRVCGGQAAGQVAAGQVDQPFGAEEPAVGERARVAPLMAAAVWSELGGNGCVGWSRLRRSVLRMPSLPVTAFSDPLRVLLRASHLLTADRLGSAVEAAGRLLGASESVVYLVDYEQALLLPLPGPGVPARQELGVDRTVAGLAFRRTELMTSPAPHSGGGPGQERVWVPLLDGVERLGVLELVVPGPVKNLDEEARALAALVAELILSMDAYTDVFARLRRRKTMTLAAEIQWDLLPPLTFAGKRLVIAGALEPAYEIGGDTFDYAVNGDVADLLVLDAIGHGLAAALLSAAAVGAYRHARRRLLDLPDIAAELDQVIAEQYGPDRFATGVLVRLDVSTGRLRWVNAGHPPPLVLRQGRLVATPGCSPDLPLGLQLGKPQVCEMTLQPGDRVLLYTDGIVEARSPDGEFFGEQRLSDFVVRSAGAHYPAPETLRRLMREVLTHQADQLQDDASIVVLEWRTGDEQQLAL